MLIAFSVTKRLAGKRTSQRAYAEVRQMCNLFVCIAVEFIVATRNFVRENRGVGKIGVKDVSRIA